MASDKFLTIAIAIAASVSVAVFAGCQPAPTGSDLTPINPGDTPITPITPTEEPPATDQPTDAPVEEPSASETPTVPDPVEKANVTGVVYDDSANRIDNVTVTAKALGGGTFTNGTDTFVATTTQGAYTLEGAPLNGTLEVSVTKSGYTTRQQTFVVKAEASQNILNFGDSTSDPSLTYAISLKPEVTSVTPAANATGIDPNTTFTLTFSTSMNTADVETNFAIYAAGSSGQSQTLSLPDVALPNRFDGSKDIGGSGNGQSAVLPDQSKFVYDATSMTAAWSDDNKKVTFTFKPGALLVTDRDPAKAPQYAISFKGSIRDSSGNNSRSDQWFRLSPVQANRVGATFKVATDNTAPKLASVSATNKADDAGQNGGNPDVILAKFSEPMVLFLGDQDGKPIPRNAAGSGYALLGNMIKYYVSSPGTSLLPNGTTTLPGGFAFDNVNSASTGFLPLIQGDAYAAWDTSDTSRATVKFVPLSDSPNGSGASWAQDVADAGSTTSLIKVVNGVTNLFVGDLLQDSTTDPSGSVSAYRVNAINAANKELTVSLVGESAAPAAGDTIRYWSTTTKASASNGATTLMLNGLKGLKKGDTLRVGASQYVTLTADPGANQISFTPALSNSVATNATVTYVSPTSTVHTGFGAGHNVWVGVSPSIMDPAGNTLDAGSNGNYKSSVSQ